MRKILLKGGLFLLLTIATLGGSLLLESRSTLASPIPIKENSVAAVSCAPAPMSPVNLCIYCCSGTITGSGSFDLFGIQYAYIDVLVTCNDGSSCYGHFEAYGVGSYYEISFSSNC